MNKNMTLSLVRLRDRINVIDQQILALVARRQRLAHDIGRLKTRNSIPIADLAREEEIICSLQKRGRELGVTDAFIRRLMTVIFRESKQMQKGKV